MKKFEKFIPHIVALILFMAIPLAYFYPQLEGERLAQHDISMWKGSAKEILDYKEKTGDETLWTNSMFGGMPAYLISANYSGNLLKKVHRALNFLKTPASFIFLTMIGFYLLLLVLGVNPWLSIVGGIAYGFSTYFFIVIGAGHNAKIAAIAYVAPMIAGFIMALKGKLWGGLALFGLFFGLNLVAGHPQITYYSMFILAAIFLAYIIDAVKQKTLPRIYKAIGVLMVGGILAFGANFSQLWFTYDYGKYSIRGKSELTDEQHNKTSGLDKDYATQWSYGIAETFDMFIPNLMGGASSMDVGEDSYTFKFLRQNGVPMNQSEAFVSQLPTYWGAQPSTSGPVYVGAIVFFLFVLGMFVLKGTEKWLLFFVTILSIMLAWGKNLPFLTDLFMDYFPAYNKFRTVSMILYIAEFTMPFMGILALKEIVEGNIQKQEFLRAFKWALGITGGICLFFALFGKGLFNFDGQMDQAMKLPKEFINAIKKDRQAMLRADSIRSLVFILLGAISVLAFYLKKIKAGHLFLALGVLITLDMWVVNKRYMDNSNFVSQVKVEKPFTPSLADKQILADKDPDFRVFNLTVSPFNDASTSYFHKSIGGYHGAKLRRYQDVIDRHLSKWNMAAFNMLNTKYFIQSTENGPVAMQNPDALGSVWFVDSVKMVNNADEEIAALNGFNPKTTAIVDKRFSKSLEEFTSSDSTSGTIKLTEYEPNKLIYHSETGKPQLAVFSEIYYPKGWFVSIDGKPTNIFRANYILRAMVIPEGKHQIEFRFDPPMWKIGKRIDFASSLILLLVFLGWIGNEIYKSIIKE